MLLFLTKPLSFPPSAMLSAILFMVGVKLIDAQGLGELYQPRRNEFFIALATAAAPSRGAWNIRRSRCDRLPL